MRRVGAGVGPVVAVPAAVAVLACGPAVQLEFSATARGAGGSAAASGANACTPTTPCPVWSATFASSWLGQTCLAMDAADAVYVSGGFERSVGFGAAPLQSPQASALYLAKFGARSDLEWAATMGDGAPIGCGLGIGPAGDIHLSSGPNKPIDFGCGAVSALGSYLAKLAPDATCLWSEDLPVQFANSFESLAVGTAGDVYVAPNSFDVLLVKLDPSGNLLWTKGTQGTFFMERGYFVTGRNRGVAVDGADNVVVAGYFTGPADFGTGTLVPDGDDAFVAKYAPDGKPLWSKRFGGPGHDAGDAEVAADATGNVFVTGPFSGEVDFGGQTLSGDGHYLVKLDPSGIALWARVLDGWFTGIATDQEGNVVVSGSRQLDSASGAEMIVAKYSPAGDLVWESAAAKGFASEGVATSPTGRIAATGHGAGEDGSEGIVVVLDP